MCVNAAPLDEPCLHRQEDRPGEKQDAVHVKNGCAVEPVGCHWKEIGPGEPGERDGQEGHRHVEKKRRAISNRVRTTVGLRCHRTGT